MKRTYVMPLLVLTLICIVVSAALAIMHTITSPIIEEAAQQRAEAAMLETLPDATGFEAISPDDYEGIPSTIRAMYRTTNNVGYLFIAASRGFGGDITIIAGVDNDGRIISTSTLSHSETRGIGNFIEEEWFLGQFVGLGNNFDDIDTIAGATITRDAFVDATVDILVAFEIVRGRDIYDHKAETEEPTEDYDNTIYEEVYYDYDDTEVIYEHEEERDISEVIDYIAEFAAYYFGRLQAAWDEDDGEMWGELLHVPVVILCEETSAFATNRSNVDSWGTEIYAGEFVRKYIDDSVVYVGVEPLGRLPTDFSIYGYGLWDGQQGVFWSWQFLLDEYHDIQFGDHRNAINDQTSRNLASVAHSSFHTRQTSIMGVRGASLPNLTSENAWISLQLEINALVFALKSDSDEERLIAAHDALSIRHARRYAYRSDADENLIKLSEGMAVYTELQLILSRDEIMDVIRQWSEDFMSIRNVMFAAIGYGYYGGALYGMLLDSFGVDWRHDVSRGTDLGRVLQEALEITEFIPFDEIDLERYGYSEIIARVRG